MRFAKLVSQGQANILSFLRSKLATDSDTLALKNIIHLRHKWIAHSDIDAGYMTTEIGLSSDGQLLSRTSHQIRISSEVAESIYTFFLRAQSLLLDRKLDLEEKILLKLSE